MDSEVERVAMLEPDAADGQSEGLTAELDADERGLLWVVPVAVAEDFAERMLDAGITAKPVGTAEGWEGYQLFTIDDLRRR